MGVHPGEVRHIVKSGNGGSRRRIVQDPQIPGGSLDELQQTIGIAFRDPTLLQEALTHSSFANESPHVSPRDNERLEYLGDAVLQLITAEYLYKFRPGANEGEMTQVRSAMVNTNTLAQLSEELGVGNHLYLGKGIAKGGGRNLKSLLANAFEAILGAVFLDAGYDAAYHFYLDRFRALPEPVSDENHKGRLQQVVQERYGQTPYYDHAAARGGRVREYTAVVFAGADPLGTGHGSTKQAAEQEAAKNALAEIARRSNHAPAAPRRATRARAPSREPAAGSDQNPPADAAVPAPSEPAELPAAEPSPQEPPAAAAEPPPVEPPPPPRPPAPAAPLAFQPLSEPNPFEKPAPGPAPTEDHEAASEAPTGSI